MMGRWVALLLSVSLVWAAPAASSAQDDHPPVQIGNPFGRPSRIPSELDIAAVFNKVRDETRTSKRRCAGGHNKTKRRYATLTALTVQLTLLCRLDSNWLLLFW